LRLSLLLLPTTNDLKPGELLQLLPRIEALVAAAAAAAAAGTAVTAAAAFLIVKHFL
jgi:hypothetical protein